MQIQKKIRSVLTSLVVFFIIIGCSQKANVRQSTSVLDQPSHHVTRGNDLITHNKWREANVEFDKALEINPNHAPALAGKAFVLAHHLVSSDFSSKRKKAQRKALDWMEQAEDKTKGVVEEIAVHNTAIRFHSVLKSSNDWIEAAESHFEEATELQEENPKHYRTKAATLFYMGQAYQQAVMFDQASQQYREVLTLQLGFEKEANAALALLQKIERVGSGTKYGDSIALSPSIVRADMAALLVIEMDLPHLYQRGSTDQSDDSYQAPNTGKLQFASSSSIPKDIVDHPLESNILELLKLGVRGLKLDARNLFHPNRSLTRLEYALLVEDILIQVTQDQTIATKFIGDTSPWTDVKEFKYYYNAARTVVSRGILDIPDKVEGKFQPEKPITGADALLGIRELKNELQSYVK